MAPFMKSLCLAAAASMVAGLQDEGAEEVCALQVGQVKAKVSATCKVGDHVQCPGSGSMCAGNQCCPGIGNGGTFPCPSADPDWKSQCVLSDKVEDCVTPQKKTALFVVGTPSSEPLYADAIYKDRLELQGYTVKLVKDTDVTESDCEGSDIMLISASISGGAVGDKLNACSTPQMIWESRLYSLNGMTADVEEAQRVTSEFFHTYHESSWTNADEVPPLPTGPKVKITKHGAESPLAGGAEAGPIEFWTVNDYGMNYIAENQLGKGAKVVAILPPGKTSAFPVDPDAKQATFFYYEKGGKLYGDKGASPAFRIGWPVFGFAYGANPSCEELVGVDCVNDSCQKNCQTKNQMIASGVNPMPLSNHGIRMLDEAIAMLTRKIA